MARCARHDTQPSCARRYCARRYERCSEALTLTATRHGMGTVPIVSYLVSPYLLLGVLQYECSLADLFPLTGGPSVVFRLTT
jgi:hypothetical protein